MYNFDQVIDRKNSSSLKWHAEEIFGGKEGMLPYWIADTDFATVPQVMEKMAQRCQHPIVGYADPIPGAYTAIQNWWKRHYDWDIKTEWMYPSYGVVTGIFFSLEALVPKGGKVLVFTPVYDPFFAAIQNSGHILVDCPLKHADNYYTIDWELFEQKLKDGVEAVVFCNPHNPIGRVWTAEEMDRLTKLCAVYDVYLLSDEIHSDFGITRPYTPAGKYPCCHGKLIVYTAISKSFNLAGLGSSCMIIPNKEIYDKIAQAYEGRWMFGPTDFAFIAMEQAYNNGDEWMKEQLAYLKGNAEHVTEFIGQHMPKIQVTRHEGTFLMWLDMTCFGKTSEELSDLLAGQYNIALGVGSHYGKQADGFMRFNIGCPRSILDQGLERLAQCYRDHVK